MSCALCRYAEEAWCVSLSLAAFGSPRVGFPPPPYLSLRFVSLLKFTHSPDSALLHSTPPPPPASLLVCHFVSSPVHHTLRRVTQDAMAPTCRAGAREGFFVARLQLAASTRCCCGIEPATIPSTRICIPLCFSTLLYTYLPSRLYGAVRSCTELYEAVRSCTRLCRYNGRDEHSRDR
jgi:hypothetical protein